MPGLDELFEAAKAARGRAWAPYSKFPVGAALRAGSGAIYAGCNVENAALPLGVCAETAAITAMILAGDSRIVDIVVSGCGEAPVTPCGACRQRVHEFADAETRVHCGNARGIVASYSMRELLPHAFGPDDLAVAAMKTGEKTGEKSGEQQP